MVAVGNTPKTAAPPVSLHLQRAREPPAPLATSTTQRNRGTPGMGRLLFPTWEAPMAGRGPAPKDPNRRARTNSDPAPLRVITAAPVDQPALPALWFADPLTQKRRRFAWPARTKEWWKMWRDSPLSADFTANDWSELMDTALLHARYWSGNLSLAGELRLRQAKFGATPEDRARLRITFAAAEEAEEKRPPKSSSRSRRGSLKALPEAEASGE